MDFALLLKAWLVARSMTQDTLATKVGVSPGAVTAWIKGSSPPRHKNQLLIVAALETTMTDFYAGPPPASADQAA